MSETRNKYHAVKADCTQGGVPHRHDSKRERDRCYVLHQRQAAGEIAGLEQQPRYPLWVNDHKVGTYVADFRYYVLVNDERGKVLVVEDVKGVRTPAYRLKRVLMQACHGVDIQEIS